MKSCNLFNMHSEYAANPPGLTFHNRAFANSVYTSCYFQIFKGTVSTPPKESIDLHPYLDSNLNWSAFDLDELLLPASVHQTPSVSWISTNDSGGESALSTRTSPDHNERIQSNNLLPEQSQILLSHAQVLDPFSSSNQRHCPTCYTLLFPRDMLNISIPDQSSNSFTPISCPITSRKRW